MAKVLKRNIHFDCVRCIEPMIVTSKYEDEREILIFAYCPRCGCKINYRENWND